MCVVEGEDVHLKLCCGQFTGLGRAGFMSRVPIKLSGSYLAQEVEPGGGTGTKGILYATSNSRSIHVYPAVSSNIS